MAKRIVKQGETGIQIAKELGISYSSLLSANPGVSSIRPGVTLRIPTTTTSAPSAFTYGPKGYTGPKDTSDPGLPPPVQPRPKRRPPVSAGRFAPPVPRPPVSAGRAAPPPPQQPYLPSRVPVGAAGTKREIVKRSRTGIVNILNRLFQMDPTVTPIPEGASAGRVISESILGTEPAERIMAQRPFAPDAASPLFETFRGSTLNDPFYCA